MKKLINKIKNIHLVVKLFLILDFIILICFALVYGPFDKIRVFWITTAMETGSHKYFANIFYSQDTIKQVMSNNYIIEINEDTDTSSIKVGEEEKITNFTSIYEREILEHDENDLYKLIEFKYKEFNCHMIAIYDPKRIEIAYQNKLNKVPKDLQTFEKQNELWMETVRDNIFVICMVQAPCFCLATARHWAAVWQLSSKLGVSLTLHQW